jgi:hypothetical protein
VGEGETVGWWTSKRRVKYRALVEKVGCGMDGDSFITKEMAGRRKHK